MYHYVRPDMTAPPFDYYHLDLEDFRKQLDYFESEYGFVDRDKFDRFVTGERSMAPNGVVLTFDDGLRDHYEHVYPELESRGLWGIFFVPIEPYIEQKILDVHRVHVLLGSFEANTLLNSLQNIVDEQMVLDEQTEAFKKNTYSSQSGAEETKEVKRILNVYLSQEQRRQVLTQLEDSLSINTAVTDYYASPESLRTMKENGMVVGAHTVTHPVLAELSASKQRHEINKSLELLSDKLGTAVDMFCYPYGKDYTFTEDTLSILRSTDVLAAFTTEVGDVSSVDISQTPYQLPRHDCTSFPHGDSSGMSSS